MFDSAYAAPYLIKWDKFQYKVFDLPEPSAKYQSYATRYLNLLPVIPEGIQFCFITIYCVY